MTDLLVLILYLLLLIAVFSPIPILLAHREPARTLVPITAYEPVDCVGYSDDDYDEDVDNLTYDN